MEKKRVRLKGHETFCIREGWLSKGLAEVVKDPKVFSVMNGADALGVGSNMAKAIRYWLKAVGLTQDKKGTGTILTELGEIIYSADPYLEEEFTLWCLHINLVLNVELATSWNVFFNTCKLEEFTREEMEDLQIEMLFKYAGTDELSVRSIKDDCNVLLQMYAREKAENMDPEDKKVSPFAKLGLLRKTDKQYKRMKLDLGHFPVEAIYYLLLTAFGEKNAISMEDFYSGENGVATVLGLGNGDFQACLDTLAKEGYVDVNRTAGLDMIYRKDEKSAQQLVKEFYEKWEKKGCSN